MPSFSLMILAAGAIGTLLLLFAAVAGPNSAKIVSRRLEVVRERHSRSTEVAAQAQMKRILANRQVNRMEGIAHSLIPNPALLRLRLQKTGRSWTLGQFLLASVALTFAVASLLMVKGAPAMLAVLFGLAVGIGIPHFVVGKMIKRRTARFTSAFADAIDLMVRGLRSGLPISETIGVVADEIPDPVGPEFRVIADKMRIGRTMEAALQDVADRLGSAEFQFFCITLAIQRETGGNLAETLSNLSDVLRKRAAMKLKIKAMSSESKASAWIVGSLPFIVFSLIWFINPLYMGGFFVDQRLIVAGIGGMIWMAIGAFIMAKMVDFEI